MIVTPSAIGCFTLGGFNMSTHQPNDRLIPRIKISKGRYRGMDGTIIIRRDPVRHTGHHFVTTWRDENTDALLGYTLREAMELCQMRQDKRDAKWRASCETK